MLPLLIALLPVLQVLPLVAPPSYVPERVFDTREKAFSDL